MNHKEQYHQWIRKFITSHSTVIDMTCGNGYDTLFIAPLAGKVVAIDIQKNAIESTKIRTQNYNNIEYINSDHSQVDYKKYAPIEGALYNLGYLPGSDKAIVTEASSTVESLRKIIPHIQSFIVISCYRGHPGGNEEYLAVEEYISSLNAKVTVLDYPTPLSPVTFCIDLT
ncbi:MAG: class I SAM-dependent methyltransferase [Erysipelothrix sp.]